METEAEVETETEAETQAHEQAMANDVQAEPAITEEPAQSVATQHATTATFTGNLFGMEEPKRHSRSTTTPITNTSRQKVSMYQRFSTSR